MEYKEKLEQLSKVTTELSTQKQALNETYSLRIKAEQDKETCGAKVVVHPYRAVTDERGVAEVRVPKGAYRLFVSGPNHIPFRQDSEITTDVTIRAELALDLGISDAEIWT